MFINPVLFFAWNKEKSTNVVQYQTYPSFVSLKSLYFIAKKVSFFLELQKTLLEQSNNLHFQRGIWTVSSMTFEHSCDMQIIPFN